jgi:4-amino-4-deoxy-L-arabinose transferase-like glycosyltransferase
MYNQNMEWFPKLKKVEWVFLGGIILVYLGLTLWNLTKLPIFVDEALYLRWAQIAWHDATWRFISLTDGKQPLYIWFVIPFMKLIHDPLAAGRTASVIAGLFTITGMGYLGYLIGGKRTMWWAMILACCSPYLFFYYRFGIMESTLVASIIWVVNGSWLLAKTRRLDIALLLGMGAGLSLLVKSSALFYVLMVPFAYAVLTPPKLWRSREILKYLGLVLVVWGLAAVIYNIQRLSPWMHMISEKNAFFTVQYREIFREPIRIFNNLTDVFRWQSAYTTLPVLLLSAFGLYQLVRKQAKIALLLLGWLGGPMLGTILLARLFAPRYIIYVTPFFLLFAAYGLSRIMVRRQIGVALMTLAVPGYLIARLLLDPIHFPYVNVDEGYVNGWSAGNGTKQIADWAVARSVQVGEPIYIYTEGTFGILPHGLELYLDGRGNTVKVEGVYPLNEIPPAHVEENARLHPETYLIINNTTNENQAGLELVAQYPKLRDNPMRLYRVLPKSKSL